MKQIRNLAALGLLALSIEACAVGGIADVTVVDRTDGRPLHLNYHQGKAWVVGKPGNEYSVRIRNRLGEDVLGVVSVDGVNVVTGETATAQQSGYVVFSRGEVDVSGWRKNLGATAAFYFTALPDSYASRTGRPDNVGVIGVALFKRKRHEPPADIAPFSPQSQAPAAAEGAGSRSADDSRPRSESPRAEKLGTGHGRIESSHGRYVGFERDTQYPQETVAIHYDSYRNLVARGVIREPARRYPQPNPFPGFVADPPA